MSVRRCILSWVFSVLACLSLSSLVAAQSRPGEHVAVLIGNELYPALNHNVDVTPNNLDAFEEYLRDAERLRSSAVLTLRRAL